MSITHVSAPSILATPLPGFFGLLFICRICHHLGRDARHVARIPFTFVIVGLVLWGICVAVAIVPPSESESLTASADRTLVLVTFAEVALALRFAVVEHHQRRSAGFECGIGEEGALVFVLFGERREATASTVQMR